MPDERTNKRKNKQTTGEGAHKVHQRKAKPRIKLYLASATSLISFTQNL